MRKLIFVFFFVVVCNYGFAINVGTSIFPIYSVVKEVGDNNIDVFYVIKPSENPHHFEPSVKIARRIINVDIYFAVDRRFDGWIKKFVDEKRIVFLNDFIKAKNPHIWLSFGNIEKVAEIVFERLGRLDPENLELYRKRCLSFKERLNQIKNSYNFNGVRVIECHPAWTEFLREVNIYSVGYVKKGKEHEPDLKSLLNIVKMVKRDDIQYMICARNDTNKLFNKIARENGLKKIVLEPLGGFSPYDDVFKLFEENLKILSERIK